MKIFTALMFSILATPGLVHAMTFSPEDFQRYRICSKEFCQQPDDGIKFRYQCQAQEGVLPPNVFVVPRPDGKCYCPCTLEYRIFRVR